MSNPISIEHFTELMQERLGELFERARSIFEKYGEMLSWDVTNVLLYAADKGKVDEVLEEMEKHWETHLQFQHPDIRGTVKSGMLGTNPTQEMFLKICRDILHIQPSQTAG